ncbi:MAG: UDP-N-acetylglucosamine 1-carboxyvinyltransferase [Candidatus Gracilibacteria bacterium]|jgi:UDP-N-acetylglucosamine 1-carboxyvinyltransferase
MIKKIQKLVVQGQKKLNGHVRVSGSKNAALPILCAALLTDEISTISNVPDIADIHTLLNILGELNVKTTFQNHTVTIDPSGLKLNTINEKSICSMRASILLLGPLMSRFPEVNLPFPGGCVLGKRSAAAHTHVLKTLGAEILNETQTLHIKAKKLQPATIIMPEQSVTATENAVMIASLIPGKTVIKLAAAEPHVQDLCHFLNKMGSKISGIGTSELVIEGQTKLHAATHEITGDYLEAGTFAIAALLTNGEVTVEGIDPGQLDSFWQKLDEVGANYELANGTNKFAGFKILPNNKPFQSIPMLRTAVYPSFATDLQAPFAVLLTQAQGQSKIFETLFEGRLNYLFELEKMGAKIEMLNPHQAIIKGPTTLKGVPIASCDIRAGAAMVLAALCAQGPTEISNINYIDRGYEKLDEKLRSLGAEITRVDAQVGA